MNISAEETVAISFIIFLVLFIKKIFPAIQGMLDSRICEVKDKIDEAERQKKQAAEDLRQAYIHKDEIGEFIQQKNIENEQKIKKLYEENERLLQELKIKQEQALDTRLRAEFVKQKEDLIKRITDLLCEQTKNKIQDGEIAFSPKFTKEELKKLV